nr:B-cell receptor-associated protein 29-like isoform X3 [Misgurnus anguillicaudatus]
MHSENVMDLFNRGTTVKVCAPMVRYSKLAFRSLVRKYDCDLCFTPMIIAEDFMRSAKARDSEFTTNKNDRPLIVQFAAKNAQTLADAACVVSPFSDGVDLNCGCPQRWAVSEGYGACLINKPELVRDMVRHVRNQIDNPNYAVSIKIRIHKDLRKTVDLCQKVEAAGVSWITVHGRTADERHQPVHYDAIKTIKSSLSIPVIANGDIKNMQDVESIRDLTGVDGAYDKMTLQWTAVASFLYVEIAVLLIFCLPFISPRRWQRIFRWNIWNCLSQYSNKGFLAMMIILVVLFLDALREVRKYSSPDQTKDAKMHPNTFDHVHMKLFRSQRNLYISGFSLFLWLVLRRVTTLINQLASAEGTSTALQTQVENVNQAAKKYMEDNELLKQALKEAEGEAKGKTGDSEETKVLETELNNLTGQLQICTDALKKSESELDAMRKQTEGVTKEYDRLLLEHQKLQNQVDSGDKKDN